MSPSACSLGTLLWTNSVDIIWLSKLSVGKNPPSMQEMRVQSLGQEDPLEKEMAIHSSTIAWKIPWTEEPGRLHVVHGVAKSWTRLSDFNSLHFTSKPYRRAPPTARQTDR